MRKAQNLIEYALIFMFVAVMGYLAVSKIDISNIKTYVFNRPAGVKGSSQISIEAMTDK